MWQDILEIGPSCKERFVGVTRVPEIAELGILLSGASHLAGNYRIGRVKPDSHLLLYTVDGSGYLHLDSGEQRLEKNSLVVLPAGQAFYFEIDGDKWTTAWFDLAATGRWESLSTKLGLVEYCESANTIFHILSVLYYERNSILREPFIKQLGHYLAETLSRDNALIPESHRMDSLFREVEKQLHYNWSIDEMCSRVHYSAPHLHRLCRQHFSRSPVQQVIFLRMERAKYLLTHTNWAIAQIAGHVGYHDVFNFSKRFKKSCRLPPAEFRKLQRK
ncbi:MAG: AraC-like DNA-binding protein [Flavobacteriales bacterium]|jgi:AraC-like DNA-binding protein